MWRGVLVVVLAGCGRFHFDATGSGGDGGGDDGGGDGGKDAVTIDALPSGLVVWFPLDTATPQDVVSGGTGTCGGSACATTSTVAGRTGLSFDGNNDCYVIADYAALHQTTPTIALRAFLSVSVDGAAFGKRVDIAASSYDTWELGAGLTNAFELTTNHGGTSEQIATPNGDLVLGQWHHLAFTWNGSMKRLYVDGIQRATGSSTMPLSYDTHDATLGCDDNGGLVRFFHGVVDDVQIYDRPLTAIEIQALAAM